ncbi:DUF6318 family protein [Kineosporia sp. NBRC 101731]|uniref:DUF6318 family protein n=1 Tax=Kineosporia sp. NBRC 101731 TaxID=3032199 RepID=UPI003333A29F
MYQVYTTQPTPTVADHQDRKPPPSPHPRHLPQSPRSPTPKGRAVPLGGLWTLSTVRIQGRTLGARAGYSVFMVGGRFRAQDVAIGFTAGLLALAGCTGGSKDPTPPPTTTISTSSTPTPSATVTPPVAPEAVRSAKGAEDFVRYFWDVHNWTYKSLNTNKFESIIQSNCTFCASTLDDVGDAKSKGSTISGSSIQLHFVAAPPGKVGNRILVATVISQQAGVETRPDGSRETYPPVPKSQSSVALQWTADHEWLVHDVSIDEPSSS